MIQSSNRALARMAVVSALIAALGVAGCGRKSGLDLPPAAAVSDPADPRQSAYVGPDGKPAAPATGPKTPTILDWLLD